MSRSRCPDSRDGLAGAAEDTGLTAKVARSGSLCEGAVCAACKLRQPQRTLPKSGLSPTHNKRQITKRQIRAFHADRSEGVES
jgi:hypothetical protein